MQSLVPHPFYLHPDHLSYFFTFALLVLGSELLASFLKTLFLEASYSLLMISIWGLIISLSFVADFFEVTPIVFGVFIIIGLVATLGVTLFSLKTNGCAVSLVDHYLSSNSLSEFLATYSLWLFGLFLLLVPLAFGFPEMTLIPNHFICNDSVIHSIMTEGISHMRQRELDPFYYSAAPRGIHSFNFYFNSLLLGIPTPRIILPTAIASYSLIVFSADVLLRALKISGFLRVLVALLPVCPFLMVSAVYAIFLGQVSAVPLVFSTLIITFTSSSDGALGTRLFLFGVLASASVASYGLFSASLVGFGIGLAVLTNLLTDFSLEGFKLAIRNFNKLICSWRGLAACIFLSLLIYPSIKFALYVLEAQGTGTVASDLTSAVGNLPEGYLSPLHFSGIWPPGVGYRESLVRSSSALGSTLIFLILLQFYLVTKAPKSPLLFLLTLALPCLASTFLLNSPYVHFKYFSYLVPAFLLVSGIGLIELVNSSTGRNKKFSSLFAITAVLGFEITCILYPLPTAKIIPSLSETQIRSFEELWHTIKGKRALVLSQEDWLQYGAQSDDFIPLTLYIPNIFNGQPLDVVVIDTRNSGPALEYLVRFPKLKELVEKRKCVTRIAERFDVFTPDCVQ